MRRFISKQDEGLPLGGGGGGGGDAWGSGKREPILPKAQTFTIITWVWFAVSLIFIVLGMRFSGNSTNTRTLECGPEKCVLTLVSLERPAGNEHFAFPRDQLKSAQAVRIKGKQIKDVAKVSRKEVRKLGYSYSVKFVRGGGTEAEELLMALESLGRKKPNETAKKITKFISDPSQTELEVVESHGFDAKGVLFIVLGLCSLLFCALIGEFSDPKPKVKRGSHASRVTKKRAAY